jgi:hypothetical protein
VAAVWEVVERVEVAARPGLVWRVVGDMPVIAEMKDRRTIVVEREPHELGWTSFVVPEEGRLEGYWWFRLAPSWNGTEVEHGVRVEQTVIPEDTDELAAIRRAIVETLANVKARAEAPR